MENKNSSEAKPKFITGWIFGWLSFIPGIGIFFGIIAIIIGITRKIRGQVFLGLGGILLSALLYGSLFYFGFVAKKGPYAEMKIQLTSQLITMDAGQILIYKNRHGKLPTKLSDLGTPSEANFYSTTDPWMTELMYTSKIDGTFELRSAGPDKFLNTGDDISQAF